MIQTLLTLLALQYHSFETTGIHAPQLEQDVCAYMYILKDDKNLWAKLHTMSRSKDSEQRFQASYAYAELENFDGCVLDLLHGYRSPDEENK